MWWKISSGIIAFLFVAWLTQAGIANTNAIEVQISAHDDKPMAHLAMRVEEKKQFIEDIVEELCKVQECKR